MKNEVDRKDNSDPDSQNDDDKGYNDDENKDRDEGIIIILMRVKEKKISQERKILMLIMKF